MKSDFYIDKVGKEEIKELLYTYHYLKDESKDFKSGFNYGLFRSSVSDILRVGGCLGTCIFTGLPVPEIAVGAFGLERNQQEGIYELSRLCIHPEIQKEEYNITLEEWMDLWTEDNWFRRGRSSHSICLIRTDDELPWSPDNVHLGTRRESLQKTTISRWGKCNGRI